MSPINLIVQEAVDTFLGNAYKHILHKDGAAACTIFSLRCSRACDVAGLLDQGRQWESTAQNFANGADGYKEVR